MPTGHIHPAFNVCKSPTKMNPVLQRTVNANGEQNITPFALITPFINTWRVCGLVTHKEPIKEFNKTKGIIHVLNFTLADEYGKTLRFVAWNELADDVNIRINEDQTYYISGDQGCIKKSNPKYNFSDYDFEIHLNAKCIVSLVIIVEYNRYEFRLNYLKIVK